MNSIATQTDEDRNYSVPRKHFVELSPSEVSVYNKIVNEHNDIENYRAKLEYEMLREEELLREREMGSLVRVNTFAEEQYMQYEAKREALESRYNALRQSAIKEHHIAMRQQVQVKEFADALNGNYIRKMQEIETIAKQVASHHTFVTEEKRKIARQRLNLDLALQQLNHFNIFSDGRLSVPHF
jgi:hypothetical protein